MEPRDIHERAFEFACRIMRLHRTVSLKRGIAPLASQLLRSGTGIGSNLEEAKAAQSRADFIAKARIALKEAFETMGRTPVSQGVLNWTPADHFGYTPETGFAGRVNFERGFIAFSFATGVATARC